MTDKQIIIDNVDVSGCRFYSEKLSTMKGTGSISVTKCNGFCTHNIRGLDDSSCYDIHIEYAKCKNNNCYYKQLKRKEQECEELKEKINNLICSANCYKYKEAERYRIALEDIRSLINNPKNCVADIIYYSDKTAHDALQEGEDANIQS